MPIPPLSPVTFHSADLSITSPESKYVLPVQISYSRDFQSYTGYFWSDGVWCALILVNSTASGSTYHKVFFNYEKFCTLSWSTLVFIVLHHITILVSKDSAPMASGCIKQNCDGKGWSNSGQWTIKQKPGCPKSRPVVQTCHVQRSCPTEAVLSSTSILKGTACRISGGWWFCSSQILTLGGASFSWR